MLGKVAGCALLGSSSLLFMSQMQVFARDRSNTSLLEENRENGI